MSEIDESKALAAAGSQSDRTVGRRPRAGRPSASADGLDSAAGRVGAPPSNTAPNTCNDLRFLPLRWGVDSLYLSYPGELFIEVKERLAALKRLAQSPSAEEEARAQYVAGDHIFEVRDKGARLFPFILEDASYRLQVGKGSKATPMAYCKLSSGLLAFKGPVQAESALAGLLGTMGELQGEARVSRVDLFVDFCADIAMDSWGRESWITKASRRDSHAIRDDFSGWSIGMGGAIAARLYNKSLEILASRKDYLRDLWREVGWDGERKVWRLEVQFEREAITQFGLSGLASVMSARNGLWSYALTEWLRLAVPSESDKTRSRWPLHPLWIALASVDWEGDGGPLLKRFSNQRAPSIRGLSRFGMSAVTSSMALKGHKAFWDGWNDLGMDVYGLLTTDAEFEGVHPDELLLERVKLKGRKFNSLDNVTRSEAEAHAQRVADEANEYRRGSGGF